MAKCPKCGKRVSENKLLCLKCIEAAAIANINAKEEAMDGATHIIIKREGVNNDRSTFKAEDLYRADGMLVASRQADIVRYGDDISTARNHIFLSEELAAKFIRRIADVDCLAQKRHVSMMSILYTYADPQECHPVALIEEREGDMLDVQTPNGPSKLVLPGRLNSIKLN